jgi:class 3 adenylate cyclase
LTRKAAPGTLARVCEDGVVESRALTQYARAADGTYLAYQVLGKGPPDLLLLMGFGVPIQDQLEGRLCGRFIRTLASFSSVIRFDRRGIGMSDPVATVTQHTLDQWVADALVVLDAVSIECPALFGTDPAGGQIAMTLAATHPDRASCLVLFHPAARLVRAPDYPWGWRSEQVEARQRELGIRAGEDAPDAAVSVLAPSVAEDDEFVEWFTRARRRGLSPAVMRTVFEMQTRLDLRRVLPAINVPTLVLSRPMVRQAHDHARYVADSIRGANAVECPGADALVYVGDVRPIVDEVEELLTGVRGQSSQDSVLATVLLSDIVASTAQAAKVGDRRWLGLLDAHDAMMRRQLDRFGGREIETTGDGFLATFDAPARAIQCACSVRDAARRLGIDLRIGLHTGVIGLRDQGVGGLTVHIAARVSALAGPGEVLVSRTVTDLVAGSDITFLDRGEHALKGVPGAWSVFQVANTL